MTRTTTRGLDVALGASLVGLTIVLGAVPTDDTDLYWHLKTGSLIRQTGQVPREDLYTFTAAGRPWINLHWGFEVGLSALHQVGGIVGVNVAKATLNGLTVALLLLSGRKRGPLWVAVLAWLPPLWLWSWRMNLRPEVLSLLWLSWFLVVVDSWERHPRLTWTLPPVMVAWVNTHGLFVLGLVVLGCGWVSRILKAGGSCKSGRWSRTLASGLVVLACLLNPYGWRGSLYPIILGRTLSDPLFLENIEEFTPLGQLAANVGWSDPVLWALSATALVALGSFTWPWIRQGRRGAGPVEPLGADLSWRTQTSRFLIVVAFGMLVVRAVRNLNLFALVVGAVASWNLAEWAARSDLDTRLGSGWPRLVAIAVISALLIGIGIGWMPAGPGPGRTLGFGEAPRAFPHEAIQVAGTAGLPARFVGFHLGHNALFLRHFGPERKVMADPRLEVLGPGLFRRYLGLEAAIARDAPTWRIELEAMGRPVVLVDHQEVLPLSNGPPGHPGATLLADASWECIWFDPIAAVFVHKSSVEMGFVRAVDPLDWHFEKRAGAAERSTEDRLALAEALLRYGITLRGRQRTDLAVRVALPGIDEARVVLTTDPKSSQAWEIIGQLELVRLPRIERGGEPGKRLDDLDPLVDPGVARAAYALRRASRSVETSPSALGSLGQLLLQRGLHAEAREVFERLGAMAPRRPGEASMIESARRKAEQLRGISAGDVGGRRAWDEVDRTALRWLLRGDADRARELWESSSEEPLPGTRLGRLATAAYARDALDEAARLFADAMERRPTFDSAFGLASVERDAGRARAALEAARAAEQLATDEPSRKAARALVDLVGPYVR